MQETKDARNANIKWARLSSWDVVYALNMSIACAISYWIITLAFLAILNF
jgi:hypothetical protein